MDGEGWGWLWLPLVVALVLGFGYLNDKKDADLEKTCIQAGRVWDDGHCK